MLGGVLVRFGMVEILLIPLSGIMRRVIGGYPAISHTNKPIKASRTAVKFLYGSLLAFIVGITNIWMLVGCGIALWLGEKPGLGHWRGMMVRHRAGHSIATSGDPEWYQIGWLAKQDIRAAYASAAVRGLVYGSLLIPIALYYQELSLLWIPLAMAIAMPLSGLMARYMPETKILELGNPMNSWAWDEFWEGLICAIVLVLICWI